MHRERDKIFNGETSSPLLSSPLLSSPFSPLTYSGFMRLGNGMQGSTHSPELAWCSCDEGKLWASLEAEQFEGDGGREEGTEEKQVGSYYYGGDGTTIL